MYRKGIRRTVIQEQHFSRQLSFGEIFLDIYPAGEDIAMVLYGGSRPHIGCSVLCVPRESLNKDGSISCTSSVLNVTGHKDELLCRRAAEEVSRRFNVIVSCSGGFHKDDMTGEEIEEVLQELDRLLAQI